VTQTYVHDPSTNDAVKSWLRRYREALDELDSGVRPLAEQHLDQVATEIESPEPHPVVVRTLLGSLREFAQSAVASAGAGAGTIGLAEVIAHWPLH
jgi:hypothetical protein